MRHALFLFFFLLFQAAGNAQDIVWSDISGSYELPGGVRVFSGRRETPKLNAWLIEADLNDTTLAVNAYLSDTSSGREDAVSFCGRTGAIAAVNGGFFGGSVSYSAVLQSGELRAQNVAGVTRDQVFYPVTRSFFSIDTDFNPSVNWIYHFGNTSEDIYSFDTPAVNQKGIPAEKPLSGHGMKLENPLAGTGGGPTLIKDGEIFITYDEEVFWGSGVERDIRDPRTAVGYTEDGRVIMLAADGRQTDSQGITLPEAAEILLERGCIEAVNLDGGGSTQMAAGESFVNSPLRPVRQVPSFLAVVSRDSVFRVVRDSSEVIIDTEDEECELIGEGWFASANSGYWGGTPSMLITPGTGEKFAVFRPALRRGVWQVYGWWVAASNRCKDTPFIIYHADGQDTVRMDQAAGGSVWNRIGEYVFSGDSTDAVRISDFAEQGDYIAADAVRWVYSQESTAVSGPHHTNRDSERFVLRQNMPNPFNSSSTIIYKLVRPGFVRLSVYNIFGREIDVLAEGFHAPGTYEAMLDGRFLASGIYFYKLSSENNSIIKKCLLVK